MKNVVVKKNISHPILLSLWWFLFYVVESNLKRKTEQLF